MKYVTFITFLFKFLIFQYLPAQAPDTLWTKTFGGLSNDWGQSLQETNDGGYIIAGTTGGLNPIPPHDPDVWLIKTDANGDTLWTKSFGGSDDDRGFSVKQTTDSGYIITGYTFSFGAVSGNVWLIKTNANGDTLWTKTYGGNNHGIGYSVEQTSDGGYIITGRIKRVSANHVDLWLIKTDSYGDTLWTSIFGGFFYDEGRDVQQTSDGGYIVTGVTNYGSNFNDIWLIKTDANGDSLWAKRFDGRRDDRGFSVKQTTDCGYIVTGSTKANGFIYPDVWLIKTDANGDTLWTKTLGRGIGYSVQQTYDEGYIISGSWQGHSLIRTDADGDSLWTKSFWTRNNEHCYFVQQTSDGGYIITGAIYSSASFFDLWLIRVDADPTGIEENPNASINHFLLKQNYPNPFNPITTIEFDLPKTSEVSLKVFNILGEEVATLVSDRLSTGSYSYKWDASSLASGVYLYRLEAEGFVETKKMVLMR